MEIYKIVNASELDNAIKSIADKLKEKLSASEETEYIFPDDFITALESLKVPPEEKTIEDIILDDTTTQDVLSITIPSGEYKTEIIKDYNLPITKTEDDIILDDTITEGILTITIPAGNYKTEIVKTYNLPTV